MSFFETGKIKFIPKGTTLLRQGEVCWFGCKVLSGCLMSYATDKSGKEHIMQFAPEGWIITDMNSLFHHVPSNTSIEAIEDSEVQWMQGDVMAVLQNASREELMEQTRLLTRNIITANKRIRLLLGSTAEERYLDFVETYPALIQRLPLKLVAAYLGITPEYLSAVRRKITRKELLKLH
jgi:CRP-like cAMP-binding protein